MPSHLKNSDILLLWPKDNFNDQTWTRDKVKAWVARGGGRITINGKSNDDTTHIVCDKATYRAMPATALADTSAKIVSIDWLKEALSRERKPSSAPFLWSTLDKPHATLQKAKTKTRNGATTKTALLMQSTQQYMHPNDQKDLDAEFEAEDERRIQEAKAEREQQQLEAARIKREHAEIIRKAGKSRIEFNDKHHIYKDTDGLEHDVFLTRINFGSNTNERVSITIFESNDMPFTYTTNIHYEGTDRISCNEVVAGPGVKLWPAQRQFREAFRELTGVPWNERNGLEDPTQPRGKGFQWQKFAGTIGTSDKDDDALAAEDVEMSGAADRSSDAVVEEKPVAEDISAAETVIGNKNNEMAAGNSSEPIEID